MPAEGAHLGLEITLPKSVCLCITNKTERFSFKSGHAMWVAELMKEDWPIVYSKTFGLKQPLNSFHE